MSFFKYKEYSYSKSEVKETKLSKLTLKYEPIFLKVLNKEDLSDDEGILFLKGFSDIKNYIVNSFLLNIKSNYKSKTPIEKKIATLYNQYLYLYPDYQDFLFRIKEDLDDICETSIYSAIGYGSKDFKKEDDNSNLILFINNSFFFSVLNFLEKKVNPIKNSKEELKESLNETYSSEDLILKTMEVEALLKEKNVLISVGKDIYEEVKDILIYEKEIPSNLIDLISYIVGK